MTTTEAKAKICEEFLTRFYEWLDDYAEMPDKEYGRKYGWQKNPEIEATDNIKSLVRFQKYIFQGRYTPEWEKAGYPREIIWQLSRDGFLSNQEYSNWNARATGRTSFYYISQKTAKQIYKEAKQCTSSPCC